MRILAIDTSCGAASVAAFEGATRETLASGVDADAPAATPRRWRRWSKA